MKVLVMSSPLVSTNGGGEKFLQMLVSSLQKKGFKFEFVGTQSYLLKFFQERDLPHKYIFYGWEPVTIGRVLLWPVTLVVSLFAYWRWKSKIQQADLIVASLSFTEMAGILFWAQLFSQNKIVVPVRNKPPNFAKFPPLLWFMKKMMQKAHITYISYAQRDKFHNIGLVGGDEKVISNGIYVYNTPKYFSKEQESVTDNSPNSVRFGYVGRLHPEKGLVEVLYALSKARFSRKVIFKVAGTGPQEKYLKDLAEDLSLNNKIEIQWLGYQSNPKAVYEELDAVIFASHGEGFGKTLIEGWERGKEVLCSDLKVFKEIHQIADIPEDWIFETGNSDSIARTLENFDKYWADNFKKYPSQRLHEVVHKNFSLETMVQSYEDLFRGVTG
jgi:glycosyltransferase involved in cell wall biosynthesis